MKPIGRLRFWTVLAIWPVCVLAYNHNTTWTNTTQQVGSIDEYVGTWKRQHDNAEIVCHQISGISVECRFPARGQERFTIDGTTITWDPNPDIKGTYNEDGTITWQNGDDWVKLELISPLKHCKDSTDCVRSEYCNVGPSRGVCSQCPSLDTCRVDSWSPQGWNNCKARCEGLGPGDYFKAADGDNCSTNQFITDRDDCKFAGLQLGYHFVREVASSNNPAGCYWKRNGYSYFNKDLDASTTWKGEGGICKQPD